MGEISRSLSGCILNQYSVLQLYKEYLWLKPKSFYLFIYLRNENLKNVDKRHRGKKSLDLESNGLNLNPKSVIYQQYILLSQSLI